MKITLLGDSIRYNYTEGVRKILGEGFEVFSTADNGRFSKYTLRNIFDNKEKMEGSSIVHWNNGLWDISGCLGDGCFTSESEYIDNMTRIADILLSRYKKVIFATTTPTNGHPEFMGNHNIEKYNSLIVPILKEKGIIINDLYSLIAADLDKYISDDHIHMTESGNEVLSKQVAKAILEAAAALGE